MFVPANLDSAQLKVIQDIEQSENIRLLALKDLDVQPAMLPMDKVAALQQLEREMGLCLLAVR